MWLQKIQFSKIEDLNQKNKNMTTSEYVLSHPKKKFGVILMETRECRIMGSIFAFAKENIEGKAKILPLVTTMGLPRVKS